MKKETLLVEIGSEELPAGYIEPALAALANALVETLKRFRIDCGETRQMGTPRRLAVMIEAIAARQPETPTSLTGPPASVGLDESGNFTLPARKFAEKSGVPVSALYTKKTDKGDYLAAEKTDKGRSTKQILREELPALIASLPFPKSMRWGGINDYFARPVHSLVALLGPEVIGFSWAGIRSGRYSRGHPFMAAGKVKIPRAGAYVECLRRAWVIVDIPERRQLVAEEVSRSAAAMGGRVLPDEELIDIVTNMVEYPVASGGRFDEKFLNLPREVLITAMRSHQRYFAVADDTGKLLPCFVAVNNTRAVDMKRVGQGHERVLRARLEDAMFFYQKDLKVPLERMIDSLKRVTFQAKLGSMHEKLTRLKALLSDSIFDIAFTGATELNRDTVLRAAELCKADLVTRVVDEFPKLQGTMGRIYAAAAGESTAAAVAVEEHYQPTHAGGALPSSSAGALLAVADKMDTICGCFAIGLVPSGTSDPYALRRHGIGIIQILLDQDLAISIKNLIETALGLYKKTVAFEEEAAAGEIYSFISQRMAQLLVDEGIPRDLVNAVLNASADRVPDVWRRARSLSAIRSRADFKPLAAGFKRVANIIKKSGQDHPGPVRPELFQQESERALYEAGRQTRQRITEKLQEGNYDSALTEMAGLRRPVDAFFDDVLVMTEDRELQVNRLALLDETASLFKDFADFSVITTE